MKIPRACYCAVVAKVVELSVVAYEVLLISSLPCHDPHVSIGCLNLARRLLNRRSPNRQDHNSFLARTLHSSLFVCLKFRSSGGERVSRGQARRGHACGRVRPR